MNRKFRTSEMAKVVQKTLERFLEKPRGNHHARSDCTAEATLDGLVTGL